MKRKLDENDVPTVDVEPSAPVQSMPLASSGVSKFESFDLDPRLLQAISKAGYTQPTPIQQQAIAAGLRAKDILAKSKTGSGKTLAYVLPTLHALLQIKKNSSQRDRKITRVLVLVPTRELAEQVHKSFQTFSAFCSKEIRSLNLTQRVSDAVLASILHDAPDVVVSTPGRACEQFTAGGLDLSNISQLVIDEADILLSYGYEENMNTIHAAIPRGIQTYLISATLSSEVDTLSAIFCNDPVAINIEDREEDNNASGGVSQYVVKCGEDEKFLLIFVIFKLKLVRGKCIVFVEDIDRCYRLKLFLEQFGIKSCVLNSELPVNSRLHAVEEFNKGLYEILIAADDQEVIGGIVKRRQHTTTSDEDPTHHKEHAEPDSDEEDEAVERPPNPTHKSPKSRDFGISRGIDFQNVACVINFDLPHTSKSYTHRIGRTARAGKSGMALSFVIPRDLYGKHKPTSIPSGKSNEKVLARIIKRQSATGAELQPYNFDMSQVDGFRYRMNDALRAVTKVAIHETRAREIKQELVKSERLRKHFEQNPEELRHLRHDVDHGIVRHQPHLKHVPEYLMPVGKGNKSKVLSKDDIGFVGFRKIRHEDDKKKNRGSRHGKNGIAKRKNFKVDPLKSFGRGGGRKIGT